MKKKYSNENCITCKRVKFLDIFMIIFMMNMRQDFLYQKFNGFLFETFIKVILHDTLPQKIETKSYFFLRVITIVIAP